MPSLLLAIPLVLFVLLAASLVILLRRTTRVAAETRGLDAFRLAAGDLATRAATSLAGASERVDAVRRGQVGADTITETLEAARDAIARYQDETRALVVAPGYEALRGRLAEELERSARAVEMIDHGCSVLSAASIGRGREVEGQVAIKRGYLNILHARESIVEIATNLRSARPSRTSPRWFSGRTGS
jgi:PAS domain-containing protein